MSLKHLNFSLLFIFLLDLIVKIVYLENVIEVIQNVKIYLTQSMDIYAKSNLYLIINRHKPPLQ